MRFLFVDRITGIVPGGAIRGVKNIAMSEDFFEHHFPGDPIMPGALLLEALVQLAGWREAAASSGARWLLLRRVRRCGYYGFARPGDTVALEVTPVTATADAGILFRGVGAVAGVKKITAEFECEAWPLAELADPAERRALMALLTREGG